MNEFLNELIANRTAEIVEVRAARDASEDAAEVRALSATIESLEGELRGAQSQLAQLTAQEAVSTQANIDTTTNTLMGITSGVVQSSQARTLSLGEHFVGEYRAAGGGNNFTATEYRANTSLQTSDGNPTYTLLTNPIRPYYTDLDYNMVQGYRRPTVTDLLSWGTISGAAITYLVEGAREGNIGTQETQGSTKAQVHYADPTLVTDPLIQLSAFVNISNQMLEDLEFLVSEINQRLIYDFQVYLEQQMLFGTGNGSTAMKGIWNRSGLQVDDYAGNAGDINGLGDKIFHARTSIQNATGLIPDGIIINPSDYETLRLARDNNNQYFGGSFFGNTYGAGNQPIDPPLWGTPTYVSAAIPPGNILVGNFTQGATAYTRGGFTLRLADQHAENFVKNTVTLLIEGRFALAVRKPAAFVKITPTPGG